MGEPKSPQKGCVYGKWKLKRLLGQGGNGFVWLAQDAEGNEAAIKLLAKLDRMSSKVYERFKREVKVIQENSDIQGIIQLIDSFLPDDLATGYPWYTMPVMLPLEKHLENQNTETIVLSILEVGKTLVQLHHRDISHRDIKPANILVKDGHAHLADFGLAHLEDNLDLTSTGDQIGAKWTIAPEMKRASHIADGKLADVYSLAKTLWILITKIKDGFDGKYDPKSKNGLSEEQIQLPALHGIKFGKDNPVYKKPLDDLLRDSTDDDPRIRPTMEMFVERLSSWLEIYKNYKRRNPLEWRDIQVELFPTVVPQRAIWERVDDIIEVLNILASAGNLNHMLLPDHGGVDLTFAKLGNEENTIELSVDKGVSWVYLVKPKRLVFESFGFDWEWNYFRLEIGDLDAVLDSSYPNQERFERLIELSPLKYIEDNEGWSEGEDLPESSRSVLRWFMDSTFLILQKTCIYNHISATYDGRHDRMSTDQFREYILEKIELVRQLRLASIKPIISLESEIELNEIIIDFLQGIFSSESWPSSEELNYEEQKTGDESI